MEEEAIIRFLQFFSKFFASKPYRDSQKFCRNRIALLDKPTVAAGMMEIVAERVRATGTAPAVLVGAGVPAGVRHK
jgi:hypothetical protein